MTGVRGQIPGEEQLALRIVWAGEEVDLRWSRHAAELGEDFVTKLHSAMDVESLERVSAQTFSTPGT